MSERILVIDDDEQMSDILSLTLESEGYEVSSCLGPAPAFRLLREMTFSLILLDLRLGEDDGLELLPRFQELAPNVPILVITAHGDVDSAVRAFRIGAAGYIRKPFQEGDLKSQISQALDRTRFDRLGMEPANSGETSSSPAGSIIRSCDPVMKPVLRRIEMAAQVSSNAVIFGESGTGKELAARALHESGPRKKAPFVAFNCAAVPETLMEAELFGTKRGAFTDAKQDKPGLFERAHGGTLFLDEIGDAPLSIQSKLLRVLQEREVLPLGATRPVKVDVRVVSATHRSLDQEVRAGRFRQDLYYRLHVLPIHLPALRERPRDILFLANYFAHELSAKLGTSFHGFTPAAEAALQEHPWPGNVRELQNRIEHALAVSQGGRLAAVSLFPESGADQGESFQTQTPDEQATQFMDSPELPTFGEAKQDFEKNYLERLLSLSEGNISRAAKLASKSRTEIYGLLRKHSLDPKSFKSCR